MRFHNVAGLAATGLLGALALTACGGGGPVSVSVTHPHGITVVSAPDFTGNIAGEGTGGQLSIAHGCLVLTESKGRPSLVIWQNGATLVRKNGELRVRVDGHDYALGDTVATGTPIASEHAETLRSLEAENIVKNVPGGINSACSRLPALFVDESLQVTVHGLPKPSSD